MTISTDTTTQASGHTALLAEILDWLDGRATNVAVMNELRRAFDAVRLQRAATDLVEEAATSAREAADCTGTDREAAARAADRHRLIKDMARELSVSVQIEVDAATDAVARVTVDSAVRDFVDLLRE